ncbi:MAG: bifunctional nuclease domain-containing protein [Chlorobiota bacterium]
MDKIELTVLGISASTASNNAFALILKESDGDKRLPIIIGAFEAQAIALEIEGIVTPRPMTHDLIKKIIDELDDEISQVYINDLQDGTFFSKLILKNSGIEIDSRPSDAIALAVRFNCPIYIDSYIMDNNAVESIDDFEEENETDSSVKAKKSEFTGKSKIEQLQVSLEKAIEEENYEKAANLRDEIKKILESS